MGEEDSNDLGGGAAPRLLLSGGEAQGCLTDDTGLAVVVVRRKVF